MYVLSDAAKRLKGVFTPPKLPDFKNLTVFDED
jgi:hypothetical protein